jgi:2-hydroxy-3-oxopropionate reductase
MTILQAEEQTIVGFMGVGQIGQPMADQILQKFKAIVYDKSEAAGEHFAGRAKIGKDYQELITGCDVIVACLPTAQAYVEAVSAVERLRNAARLRTFVVVGTTGSALIDDLFSMLNGTGIELVDAPITGGPHGARLGTLTTMAAGSADALARVQPIIDCYSKQTILFGSKPGAAQTMKLVNNLLSVANLVLASEAMTLGLKAGLDPEKMFEVLNAGTAQNYAISSIFPRCVFTRSFDFGGHLELGAKDYQCLMDESEKQGATVAAAKAVHRILLKAIAQQGPKADFSTIVKYFEADMGVQFPQTRSETQRS